MFVLSGIGSKVMIYRTVYDVHLLPLVASKVMPKVNIFPITIEEMFIVLSSKTTLSEFLL
jgi:hypothetical protein